MAAAPHPPKTPGKLLRAISSWRYRRLWARMRLVLDSDVLVAGFCSGRDASRQLLLAALDREFTMLVSVPLMIECEAVLTRPEHLREAGISRTGVDSVLDALAAVIEPVQLQVLWRPRLKDPADEMVLETAVNGGADYLVTFNLRHLAVAAGEFGISVFPPGALWRRIRGLNHEKK